MPKKNCNPPHFYLPTWEIFAPPYTSPDLAQNLISDRSWASPLYMKISGGDRWQRIRSFICNSFVLRACPPLGTNGPAPGPPAAAKSGPAAQPPVRPPPTAVSPSAADQFLLAKFSKHNFQSSPMKAQTYVNTICGISMTCQPF